MDFPPYFHIRLLYRGWHEFRYSLHMQMREYLKLSLGDKADMLWKNGLFIETFSDKVITANLYFIDNFFVEVVVTHNNSQIKEITPFRNGSRLEKYLDMISLKELI